MPARRELVLGQGSSPAEDELRLPAPPGIIRRFWARHPRWTDAIITVVVLLLTAIAVVTTAREIPASDQGWFVFGVILSSAAAVALIWRRRFPLAVFVFSVTPILVVTPAVSNSIVGAASLVAIYSLAVYRSTRAAMWALAGTTAGVILIAGFWTLAGTEVGDATALVVGTALFLLIGALIGVNVGNRKRYVDALIARSHQLVTERDQQLRLAAAAERTRIAREMHDIVSHSLTVVVALAEGAIATDDVGKAREASRAVAATAREALSEMRVMLGVLRTDSPDDPQGGAPLEPLLQLSLNDVVAAARAAGFPVSFTVTGAPVGSAAHRLAVLRIVQEGLTNAMRYSHDAGFIRVVTEYTPDRIRVSVENDGARPAERSAGAGLGIQGLRERVSNLGGTLTAGAVATGVWLLSAELPWEGSGD